MSADVKPSRNATLAAFGERVRARRTELGLSQEQAAEKIGVHFTYLGRVERGQRSLRLESVLKIAAGLGTTPGRLMDGLPTE
ncbi:helix-turn-helix transcriptional regulator [Gordonia sp. ABSL1-1]|uniref:helix-turn-helix domain-containing protein n=1 Tax=Gordonia sp. ABSL1-1 TaxID=3053923 RepID=UPI002572B88E|nr:helix-turn-helix transcriptional regulator [Gordonia sp. ABSL1-1]MDL9935486.1 helix-turn-helix transcriptional regulator [Gordonia sp. ABSL1-1]